ncbi:MAG: NADH-quinone oxidoreductase subunit K [Clostridia bacterium]|nr:NADH-quinone oxidoreductase subunit K [Clostridia bacterium]
MINLAAIVLMLLGLYALLTTKHIIKMVVGLNVFEVGLNLFVITIGFNKDGIAPILTGSNSIKDFVDPLPQAIVLTAIVIGFGITAVALMVARKIHEQYGTYDINEIGGK